MPLATSSPSWSSTPEEGIHRFVDSINRGEVDAATACFSKDACLLTPDKTAVRGRMEIRPILRQLVAAESQIEVHQRSLLRGGHVALAFERWSITSSAATPFTRTLDPTLVMQQLEEVWKIAVAAPWARREGHATG